MKKLIALLLALVMVISLTACATKKAENDDKKDSTQSQDKNDKGNQKEELLIDEVTVLDNELCVIKITGIDPDHIMGYTLKGYFENKSEDKTYAFAVDSATINGIQCDPYFSTEVAPGKKAKDPISFDVGLLEMDEVGDFTDIELNFVVYDSEDWLGEPVAQATAHVYPYGEDKAASFVREIKDTDTVLVDNEYVQIVAVGTLEDEWGYNVVLYMQNKSDKNLTVSTDEVSVNGYMMDPFFGVDVAAGMCSYDTMNWFASEFDDNDITKVEEIAFKLYVSDTDDWGMDDYVDETIIYCP